MEPDLTWVYSTLSAAGVASVTWLFSRKKQQAETVQTELDNVQKAVEIWRQTAEDLKKEVEQLRAEVKELQKVVADLHKENLALKEQVSKFNT
jgi:peptidoglycan hydrolase CwlO-like protein